MNLCGMAHHLIYLNGKPSLEETRLQGLQDLSIQYWKMVLKKKQPESMCNLAICYLEGKNVHQDLAKSKELFKKAIKAHHPKAKKYYKEAHLDKWNPGDDYESVYLTTMEAMRNSVSRPKKKTTQEILTETVQTTIAKSLRTKSKKTCEWR